MINSPQLQEELKRLTQAVEGIAENVFNELKNKTINKIIKPLKEAEYNYDEKEKRKREIENKLKDLEPKIKDLEAKYDLFKREINKLKEEVS